MYRLTYLEGMMQELCLLPSKKLWICPTVCQSHPYAGSKMVAAAPVLHVSSNVQKKRDDSFLEFYKTEFS